MTLLLSKRKNDTHKLYFMDFGHIRGDLKPQRFRLPLYVLLER